MENEVASRRDITVLGVLTSILVALVIYALSLPDTPTAMGQASTPGISANYGVGGVSASGGVSAKTIDAASWSRHTCVTNMGIAYCWGLNESGQLGDGTSTTRSTPVAVTMSGGTVTGTTVEPVVGAFSTVVTGGSHSCALGGGGVAYCWGASDSGQLGEGTIHAPVTSAVPWWNYGGGTLIPLPPTKVTGNLTFASLTAGGRHTCGLTSAGIAYCWGDKLQIGYGTASAVTALPSAVSAPQPVSGGLTFASLTAGGSQTCGLTTSGDAYCWGPGAIGNLNASVGSDWTKPVAVVLSGQIVNSTVTGTSTYPAVTGKFASLTSGGSHVCGITTAKAAYCWGDNSSGQIGTGTIGNPTTVGYPLPMAVTGGLQFVTLKAGERHTCGITTTNGLYCWGENSDGRLGDGSTINRASPVPVVMSGSTVSGAFQPSITQPFVTVNPRGGHTCGLTSGNRLYCWGRNGNGELGDGTNRWSSVPVPVSGQDVVVTPPTAATAPKSVRFTNVRDTSFTLSWTTGAAVTGTVRWGLAGATSPSNVANDRRGALTISNVHAVTVAGLLPNTQYAVDIESGGTTDTNGGAHYTITTGPTIDATSPKQVYGTVSTRDGTAPSGVLVHVTAAGASTTSAPITGVISAADKKTWLLDLGNLRTAALDAAFPVTDATVLTITADGGPDGTASGTATVAGATTGSLALTLSDEIRVPMMAGWNLISLQATPATAVTASVVCSALNATPGAAVELDRWVDGGWEGHRCGVAPNDFAIETGHGYFVRLTTPATWAYRGSVVQAAQTLSLSTGWNLVGPAAVSGYPTTASASCATFNAVAGTAVEIDRWVAGGWEGHRCDLPPNDFSLQVGQGVFVRLTRPTTWTLTGAAPVSASSVRRIAPTPTVAGR